MKPKQKQKSKQVQISTKSKSTETNSSNIPNSYNNKNIFLSDNNLNSEKCTATKMVQEYTILRKVYYKILTYLSCLLVISNNYYYCCKLIHFNFYYE